ncbi:hypothetical protein ElyMa_006134000 [Elysia marginata]|uniref:Uncharacterized protein n=1 Tax=Elysia marginata TaxID=1093978 RepID=A0AAV4GW96_9GAST|nr:hypothetical protein ElyMa_006134000 [Elysia marginata]
MSKMEEEEEEEKIGRIEATLEGFLRLMKEMIIEVKEIGRTVKSIDGKVEIHEGILSGLSEKVEKNSKTLNDVQMQRKVNSSSEEVKEVSEKIKYMEERLNEAEERVIEQVARSRRSNLIYHGVLESDREDCGEGDFEGQVSDRKSGQYCD